MKKRKDQWWNRADGSYVWSGGQEVETDGVTSHSPGPESVTDVESTVPVPPAPDDLVKAARQAEEEGRYAERYRTMNANRICGKLADRIEALERRVAELENE